MSSCYLTLIVMAVAKVGAGRELEELALLHHRREQRQQNPRQGILDNSY